MKGRLILVILSFFSFLLGGPSSAQTLQHFVMKLGTLDEKIIGPVLRGLSAGQALPIPNEVEIKDKNEDYKITATVSEINLVNLFQNLPEDHYSIGFGSSGQIIFHCHLPRASLSSKIHLEAKERGGSLLIDGDIDRKYRVQLDGLNVDMVFNADLIRGQMRISSSHLANLWFDSIHIKQKKNLNETVGVLSL